MRLLAWQSKALSLYPALAAQLIAETHLDPEWNPCGLLITKNPDITAAIDWCNTNKIAFQQAGEDFFNDIDTIPNNPLWLPEIAQARNPRLVKSLKQDLINKGVSFNRALRININHSGTKPDCKYQHYDWTICC